jgi:hypothetical protein
MPGLFPLVLSPDATMDRPLRGNSVENLPPNRDHDDTPRDSAFLISALRERYGQDFAPGEAGTAKVSDVLHRLDPRSRAKLIEDWLR